MTVSVVEYKTDRPSEVAALTATATTKQLQNRKKGRKSELAAFLHSIQSTLELRSAIPQDNSITLFRVGCIQIVS